MAAIMQAQCAAAPAGQEPSCFDLYEDLIEMALLAGVFAVGWFLFHWLAISAQTRWPLPAKGKAVGPIPVEIEDEQSEQGDAQTETDEGGEKRAVAPAATAAPDEVPQGPPPHAESERGHPNGPMLAAEVRLHAMRGDLSRALEVFEVLPRKHGFEPDARAYHALISACLTAGRSDLALDAFGRLLTSGCVASVRTFEVLIMNCLRRGDLERSVALVQDALGISAPGASAPAPLGGSSAPLAPPPAVASPGGALEYRVLLGRKVVEDVLQLAGRRNEAARLGVPLLARLQEAGFEVSESVALAIHRAASVPATPGPVSGPGGHRQARAAEWQRWRQDFGRSHCVSA